MNLPMNIPSTSDESLVFEDFCEESRLHPVELTCVDPEDLWVLGGIGYGDGYGFGYGYGYGWGDGYGGGNGYGNGVGYGSGYGSGDGHVYGDGRGDGRGYGDGYGWGIGSRWVIRCTLTTKPQDVQAYDVRWFSDCDPL